jgi:hypothetical protein
MKTEEAMTAQQSKKWLCLVSTTLLLIAAGCAPSPEQKARDTALELERQFWLASRAKTDSRVQIYERSAAVAEAWLIAGDLEQHQKWKEMSRDYADAVAREREIQRMGNELREQIGRPRGR